MSLHSNLAFRNLQHKKIRRTSLWNDWWPSWERANERVCRHRGFSLWFQVAQSRIPNTYYVLHTFSYKQRQITSRRLMPLLA